MIWKQWKNKKYRTVVAHIEKAPGRALCGSAIPASAEVPPKTATPVVKCAFCTAMAAKAAQTPPKPKKTPPKPKAEASVKVAVLNDSGGALLNWYGTRVALNKPFFEAARSNNCRVKVTEKSLAVYLDGKRWFFKRSPGLPTGEVTL